MNRQDEKENLSDKHTSDKLTTVLTRYLMSDISIVSLAHLTRIRKCTHPE
jgi:hypothetical protein